jgi:hypothetical protein
MPSDFVKQILQGHKYPRKTALDFITEEIKALSNVHVGRPARLVLWKF